MKLTPHELKQIVNLTLDQYSDSAEDFWEGTRGHDVSQNISALLQYIEGHPPFTLLDLGCGPGRDLKALADRGHRAIGLDGAARFTAMARAHSGCEDGNRISSSSICRTLISTVFSPMQPCSTYRARSCHAYCWNSGRR
jgi:predicted TPR repeat methyltransferase